EWVHPQFEQKAK
nr:Chain C, GLU-TRP-VAL-HIS-PRO-GLN-PHE-GLU-GLN-LYS-ALA-LYS Peptide [Homo sapiens]5N7X_D Chain D, GLU-TRP-VAL-HIS-PRO-GLN-PHE-GLU-GLN-LYS-ALA-LYS Peptide [Homo sapiens]5N7X_G Chain G, GLU-TRP-VAL-HIS-PRO-GLN-PHE-GLU-GLN-LYS-ALA-LYS Peptide [Homo sapiens]5N7X_I Chain I, GLU-TRP-VAL-HIS-PRO-GLN-PHE-GLU-GLN-LYS-ALA-LYS Peptide [Homo sapiens]5N7X_J Chain J, GLU-TRP-VAL-HIS-PRO-GLN-PHE-GLU-GLN-LYS-ALA-LYS Peptide [Homo sapiens]5N7X_L Chain L, GLU-TRP-VAL-HIS-PRO-GLN-PHE-GLU-GLN-LYS-ALA-LYS Peptide 